MRQFVDNDHEFMTMQMHQVVWQNKKKKFNGEIGIVSFHLNIQHPI
jgi:hypothetical protein